MSKAFTKDDAGNDEPLLVRPRAPLPAGVVNYVTPRGLAALKRELALAHAGRGAAGDDLRDQQAWAQRLVDLEGRIAGAQVVDPAGQPRDVVRFGATVTVRQGGETRRLQIVGVDEADAAHGLVAFVSPMARALLGKRAGEAAIVRTPRGEDELEVVAIAYEC